MRWIVRTVDRVADVCRAQGRLVQVGVGTDAGAGGGTRAVAAAAAARSGGRPAASADVAPSGRRRAAGRDAAAAAPPPPASAAPVMAGWFDWIGGLGATETAAGQGGHQANVTLWLAVIAGLGALGLAGFAARSHALARYRDHRSILQGTRAARGEAGQALPLLLLVLLLLILAAELVLAILTL
jgi:hypothetical protein